MGSAEIIPGVYQFDLIQDPLLTLCLSSLFVRAIPLAVDTPIRRSSCLTSAEGVKCLKINRARWRTAIASGAESVDVIDIPHNKCLPRHCE